MGPKGILTNIPPPVGLTTGIELSIRGLHAPPIGPYAPSGGTSTVAGDTPSALQQPISSVSGSMLLQANYVGLLHESMASVLDHSHCTLQTPLDTRHSPGLSLAIEGWQIF